MAESALDHLKEKLDLIGDGYPWYGKSFAESLESIEYHDAFYKKGLPHSIAELLAHIIQWKRFVIEKLIGNDSFDVDDMVIKDWPVMNSLDENEWSELKQNYFLIHAKLIQVIHQIDASQLELTVPGRTYNFAFMISGSVDHDIYHLGQILLTYKIIKSKK